MAYLGSKRVNNMPYKRLFKILKFFFFKNVKVFQGPGLYNEAGGI